MGDGRNIVACYGGLPLIVEALVRNRPLLSALLAALLTFSASAAQAGTFVLTLTDVTGGESYSLDDNELILDGYGDLLGDLNPSLNGIVFSGRVGRFDVQVLGNVFIPGPSGAPVQMNLSNFLVSSDQGGTFTATLEKTGLPGLLAGPSILGIANYGAVFMGGTGSVTFQSWVNGQTVFNPQVTTSTDPYPGPPPPTAISPVIAYAGGDLSLVSTLTFEVSPGGAMQADTALRVENVPEPTTLLLFGPGMVGLAALRRRLRTKAL
jgi:hypothetical protein